MEGKDLQDLERRRTQLRSKLAGVSDMRPGSLVERRRKCGKASCHCAKQGDTGHADWILTRAVAGKTVTRSIPASAAGQTREQLAEHRRFRQVVREFVEINERVCDTKLQQAKSTAAGEAAEKKGSKKHSVRK